MSDDLDLENALEDLRRRVEEDRRANDLKERELDQKERELVELRAQNQVARRTENWIRDLAHKSGEAIQEMRAARRDLDRAVEALAGAIREQGEEQARVNDHVIDTLNRVRDAMTYILSILARINNGEAANLRDTLVMMPGNPEDAEEFESVRRLLKQYQRNLFKLQDKAAKAGGADLETSNQIEAIEAEMFKLEARLKKLS